jgi:hypothetical protein
MKLVVAYCGTIFGAVLAALICRFITKIWIPTLDPWIDRVLASFCAFMTGFVGWSFLVRKFAHRGETKSGD